MWAQIIRMTLRSETDVDLPALMAQLQQAEQADSGLIRTITMQDQADPRNVYTLIVFETEEKARLREQDPRRAEAITTVQATMAKMFDGAPEFTNLSVVFEA